MNLLKFITKATHLKTLAWLMFREQMASCNSLGPSVAASKACMVLRLGSVGYLGKADF